MPSAPGDPESQVAAFYPLWAIPLPPHQARVASSGPVGDKASNRVEDSRYALRSLCREDPITAVETVAVRQRRLLQLGWGCGCTSFLRRPYSISVWLPVAMWSGPRRLGAICGGWVRVRCLMLASVLGGTDEHFDPEADDEQIQDHLGRDEESRGLTGG